MRATGVGHKRMFANAAPLLAALALLSLSEIALASETEQRLRELYKVDVEVSACKGAQISSSDQMKLDDAIDLAEQKSGLDEAARQAIYETVEADAQKDINAFCNAGLTTLSATLQALPK